MEYRVLGRSGLQVSAIGARLYGHQLQLCDHLSKEDGVPLIWDAVDRGVTFFDTAEVYGPFENEELLGERSAPCAIR